MDLELVHLDLRYAELRTRSADRERRLLASLAEVGQQTPVWCRKASISETIINRADASVGHA